MTKQVFKSLEDLKQLLPEDKVQAFEAQKQQKQKAAKTSVKKVTENKKKPKKAHFKKKQIATKPIDPKLQAIFDALNWLKQTFPQAFLSPPQKVSALKVGIGQDIADYVKEHDCDISLTQIRKAIAMYTRNFRYLTASSIVGNPRIDLQGEKVGEINEEQAQYAKEKLQLLNDKKAQKKDADNTAE